MIRSYKQLTRLPTFLERYEYLKLVGVVGESTFGYDRYLNQMLYSSREWKRVRDIVIIRDNGCDLGDLNYEIKGRIIIHHMNPISIDDIEKSDRSVMDPDFLVCTSHETHQAIHYGDKNLLPELPIVRRPGDTCLWR